MSTRLTNKGIPMVESHALSLVLGTARLNDLITRYLSMQLQAMGYQCTSPSILGFLSRLECGVNHASDIARNLGVSRQMVAKTVRELCQAGYLEQVDGQGRQKDILFTITGEQLIADARQVLARLDQLLIDALGEKTIPGTLGKLNRIQHVIIQLVDT